MTETEKQLALINPSERCLLLPHCLRRSATCQGTYDEDGLHCCSCNPDCPINQLQQAAHKCGYGGICVAPGGWLAVRYVKEHSPQAIVAVACEKELEEGVGEVMKLTDDGAYNPVICIIPLTKDGCVDTEVDVKKAVSVISLGCVIETSL